MKYNVDLTNTKKYTNDNDVIKFVYKKNNIKNINQYRKPSLDMIKKDIYLPKSKQIHDMAKGTKLIKYAIKHNWFIAIYSDYDCDGITSNTIMYSLLKRLGAKHVLPYCPDRIKDGYGINMKESKKMVKQGVQLVITTDNGIAKHKEVAYLRRHHVDVILTDHHNWKRTKSGKVDKRYIPKANAIIMPNCPFDKFHFDDFCGGGIAFMIATYMLKRVPTEYLAWACLATIADNVSLRQENRVIVYYGLKQIKALKNKGVTSLLVAEVLDKLLSKSYYTRHPEKAISDAEHITMVDLTHLTANDLSFSLIPVINAMGRLSNANKVRGILLNK